MPQAPEIDVVALGRCSDALPGQQIGGRLEAIADRVGAPHARIAGFKSLAVRATLRVAGPANGFSMLPAVTLLEWPVTNTAKCLGFHHPDDPPDPQAEQEATLLTYHEACRKTGREGLAGIVASRHGPLEPDTTASVLRRRYETGLTRGCRGIVAMAVEQPAGCFWALVDSWRGLRGEKQAA